MKKVMTEEEKTRKKEKDRESHERRMANPAYAAARREKARLRAAKWRNDDPERARVSAGKHRAKNREKILAVDRERGRLLRLDPTFRAKRREIDKRYRKRRAKVRNDKRKSDPAYLLLTMMRSRLRAIRAATDCGAIPEHNRTRFEDYFGATPEVVVDHIESQFSPEMTWENKGKLWHLDHIVPLIIGYGNEELLAKLNHYKNLRPLLAVENIRKGNRMPDFFPDGVPFTMEEVGWSPPPLKERGPTEVRVQDAGDSAVGAVGVATGV